MYGRTIARAASAVTALGLGATAFVGPAAADPTPAPSPVEAALISLTERAGTDEQTRAGVTALHDYTRLVDVAALSKAPLRDIAANFVPFAYAAPTFGCGSNGPVTTVIAAGVTDGVHRDQGVSPDPGFLRFSATPAHSGVPLNSGLVVAWVNINNGRSGVDALDDRTEVGLPTLSRTVDSGPGTVLASMWGVINYPFANCVMTPTVGTFLVPDVPVAAPAPAPETVVPTPATTAPAPPPAAPAAPATTPQAPAPAPVDPGLPAVPVPPVVPPPAAADVQQQTR